MKRKSFRIGFIAIAFLSIVACKKDKGVDCVGGDPPPGPNIYFNIVDSTTSQDLFFSQNPKYTKDQIIYFIKIKDNSGNIIYDTLSVGIDSSRKCLVTFAAFPKDSFFIKIADLTLDSGMVQSYKSIFNSQNTPCSLGIVTPDSIYFDHQLYKSNDSGIVTFKK